MDVFEIRIGQVWCAAALGPGRPGLRVEAFGWRAQPDGTRERTVWLRNGGTKRKVEILVSSLLSRYRLVRDEHGRPVEV